MRTTAILASLLVAMLSGAGSTLAAETPPSVEPSPSSPPPPVVNPICEQAFRLAEQRIGAAAEETAAAGDPAAADDADDEAADDEAAVSTPGTEELPSDRLDDAVRACASLDDWRAAAQLHPDALGGIDPLAHLLDRCLDAEAGLDAYATCRSLALALATPDPEPTPTAAPEATPKPSATPKPTARPSGQRGTPIGSAIDLEPGADGLVQLPKRLTAKVPGASRVRYFRVGGRSAAALVQQTLRRARKHCGSHRALACVNLRWQVQTTQDTSASSCAIGGVSWTLDSTVYLPRWSRPDRVDPDLVRWWRKVLRQSARHEAQHIRIQRRHLRELKDRMVGKSCSATDRMLERLAKRSGREQAAFDRKESAKPLPPAP